MAKLLRLDVAQLTDVGRKREHNEDNMAYVIPKDGLVMARKGALFIVADGMGGHAAGEVASEIAVDTVSNTYYQDDNDDVPTSLLYSIRRANAAIHQRAAENMLRSGMGTTCVAAILRGNTAYIANVGDSRAYLVRGSRIRQISQDHSWVAEQVRAGLLTEEQARTHAQRNVITRSLGTQTEVEIDIFRETLEEGDTLLLCSDGLTGCVQDEELQRSLGQLVPQESVYHLIERANENGGGDNITAVVARVQELGVEPPNVRQPVPVGGPELSEEDTARLFAPASSNVNVTSRNGEVPVPGSPFPYNSSGPLVPSEAEMALKGASRAKKRRNRLFYPTLALLLLLVLAGASTGVYYFIHTNQTKIINQTLADANQLITQAGSQVTKNPQQALQNLSSAQIKLKNLQKNYSLDSTASSTLTNLETQLVSATRVAVTNYNQTANITLLPCSTSTPDNLSSGIQAQTVAVIKNASNSTTATYMLAKDGKIYQFNGQSTLSSPFPPDQNTQFISIAGASDRIFALSKQQANYAVVILTPGAQNTLSVTQSLAIDVSKGQLPTLITSWSNNVAYVAFSSSTTPNAITIVSYTFDSQKNTLTAAPATTIAVTAGVVAITAFPDQLFLLLADGEVLSAQIKDGNVLNSASPVVTSTLLMFPLTNETPNFTSQDSVPTAPQSQGAPQSTNPLKLENTGDVPTMSAGMVTGDKTNHLYIAEPAYHRVLDLEILPPGSSGGPDGASQSKVNTTGTNVTLSLVQQYVSPTYFNTIKSVTLDPVGASVNILGQNTSNIENLVVVTAGKNQACAS